jgi:hypothetical protein
MLEILFGSTLFSSKGNNGDSKTKRSKELFQGSYSNVDSNKNDLKTIVVEASRFIDRSPFDHASDLDSSRYLTKVTHVGEPYYDTIYSPSWPGG